MKTLKHYGQLALLFIAAAMLTVSCSKDKQLEKDIQGTWNATKKSEDDNTQRIVKKVDGKNTTYTLEVTAEGTYTFNSDNTGSYELDYEQKWYKDGQLQSDQSGSFQLTSDYEWEVDNEKLYITYETVTYSSQEEVYTIEQNGDDKMVLNEDESESTSYQATFNDPQTNDTYNINIYYDLTLNK